jgi:hypothetical protein
MPVIVNSVFGPIRKDGGLGYVSILGGALICCDLVSPSEKGLVFCESCENEAEFFVEGFFYCESCAKKAMELLGWKPITVRR